MGIICIHRKLVFIYIVALVSFGLILEADDKVSALDPALISSHGRGCTRLL